MIDQKKKEIRKHIRELKQKYSLEEKKRKSKVIFEQIEKLKKFDESEIILAYWSMNDEVFTHDFIQKWFGKKEIILPTVNGDDLELRKFDGIENMKKGESFGIDEPDGDIFDQPGKIDFIIVPGVAFDKSNNRLGRGKAYYDKLLKSTKKRV